MNLMADKNHHGMTSIMWPLKRELTQLKNEGFTIEMNGKEYTIYARVLNFSGDNQGMCAKK